MNNGKEARKKEILMKKEKNQPINLLPKSVKRFFMNSVDKKVELLAERYIQEIEKISEALLHHHLEFEMERLETSGNESAEQEEYRLAVIYANSSLFNSLKEEFKKTEKKLRDMNDIAAKQVILHIEDNTDLILSEMVAKKELEISSNNPFRASIGNVKHIH